MKRFITSERKQIAMFSQTIADHLPEDHEVFGFAGLLDSLDYSCFLEKYSKEGGKAYEPKIIFSILVYGYHRGWRSSRNLQCACLENDAMRYLVGGHQVKFRAIADFRIRFKDEIDNMFRQCTVLVQKKVPSVGKKVKVDGSKFKASAADDQTYKKKDLEARKEKLEKYIKDYLEAGIELDIEEDLLFGSEKSGQELDMDKVKEAIEKIKKEQRKKLNHQSLPKNKTDTDSNVSDKEQKPVDPSQKALFIKRAEQLNKISNSLEQNKDKKPEDKINLTDKDAKFMKFRSSINQGYNVQFASSEEFIMAVDVATNNSENDLEQIPNILDQVKSNTGINIEELLADAGYFHESALEYLEKNSIDGYIPEPRQLSKERKNEDETGYESYNLQLNSEKNCLVCPAGKELSLQRQNNKNGKVYYTFSAKPIDCVVCPTRSICCTNKDDLRLGYRKVEIDEFFKLKQRMIDKMRLPESKAIYKKRGSEIEPIFGTIKQWRNFREFLLRGVEKVKVELNISSIGFNFGKLIRYGLA